MRNENIAVNPPVETGPLTRRRFIGVAAMLAPGLCAMGPEGTALAEATTKQANLDEHNLTEEIKKEKIRRAMLAGPSIVTAEATVAEMDRQGNLTVLRHGTNQWVCVPGDQNIVGKVDMALDPMGMLLTASLLLAEGLKRRAASRTLERAVAQVARSVGSSTLDTRSFTDAVIDVLPDARTDVEHYEEVWH